MKDLSEREGRLMAILKKIILAMSLGLAVGCFHSSANKKEETDELEASDSSDDDKGDESSAPAAEQGETETAPDAAAAVVEAPAIEAAAPSVESPASAVETPATVAANGDQLTYVIMQSDTLSRIAKRVYGDVSKWMDIHKNNPQIKNPNVILPGDTLQLLVSNEDSRVFAARYTKGQQELLMVKVEKGDTLAKIAEEKLHHKENWKVLWHYNKNHLKSPKHLIAGKMIAVPQGFLAQDSHHQHPVHSMAHSSPQAEHKMDAEMMNKSEVAPAAAPAAPATGAQGAQSP